MNYHCINCGKKDTKYRTVDKNTHICNSDECASKITVPTIQLDGNKTISEIPIADLQIFLQQIITTTIENGVQKIRDDLSKEINNMKVGLDNTKKEVTKAKVDIIEISKKLEATDIDLTDVKTGLDNCTKYLINADRDYRRKNVILFGVPDNKSMEIGEDEIDTDGEKIDYILNILEVDTQSVKKFMRLGPASENVTEKPRPIKLILDSDNSAYTILSESRKLSSLKPLKIYAKPDKSKAELSEFQRIGKRKAELLTQYPTKENEEPRVRLEKGQLKLDNVVVDTYKPIQSLF